MIDFHMHVGRLYFSREGLSPSYLLDFMERNGIERAVLLPIESPECTSFYVSTDSVLDICRRFPNRFIPFCNVDPRRSEAAEVLAMYREMGCRGYGEAMSGLWVDDPLLQTVYETCGNLGMPVLFDFDDDMNLDDPGLRRFERMLEKFPGTTFVGHGPIFWAEISGDFDRRKQHDKYPSGPVTEGGAVPRLLSRFDNLFADLSAGSGFRAMSRDPDFTDRFLKEYCERLLFGTDICYLGLEIPHADFLRSLLRDQRITDEVYASIAERNAIKLLKLDE